MKIGLIGAGHMGSAVIHDLLENTRVDRVKAIDSDVDRLKSLQRKYPDARLSTARVDVRNLDRTATLLKGLDAAVGALPHEYALMGIKAAVKARVDYVDLIFMWTLDERLWNEIDKLSRAKGIMVISPCGLAPGLTNILAMHGCSLLEKAEKVKIYVGGIPKHPKPPLKYRILFSIDSLWDEYTRPATIVKHRRLTTVKPLTGLEKLSFPGLGKLEAFYTDGLSTLLKTIKGINLMFEKTLRWPGHAAQIRTLIECGLLDINPIGDKIELSSRQVLSMVLAPRLEFRYDFDITVLRIDVTGVRSKKIVTERFEMIDQFDRKNGITSMARTTAYPASVVAQMIPRGIFRVEGFTPPESVFKGSILREFLSELKKRKIRIRHNTISHD